jgi:hypothetical protein
MIDSASCIVINSMRARLKPGEKIVLHRGIPMIVVKSWWDRLKEQMLKRFLVSLANE